jgi:hypothetical protein
MTRPAPKRLTSERLEEIAGWLLDDPDFYINCTEREATDAIRDLLADRASQDARIAEMERELAALSGYAQHTVDCAALNTFLPCDCGLRSLTSAKERAKP